MARLIKPNFVVVKGESRSESGLVCTLFWDTLEQSLRLAGWLKSHESVEKVRFTKEGLDIFIDGNINPGSFRRKVKEKK